MKESDIQRSILDGLKKLGHYAVRVNSGGAIRTHHGSVIKLADAGTPDILACINGRFFGIEVKKPKEKLREEQEACKIKILSCGGVFVRATCLGDVLKMI